MLHKFVTAAAVVAALAGAEASAQDFPNRTVTIVNPFSAGGSSDAWLRPLARWLSDYWKQPVVIEYKPGAGTTLAAAYVAEQKPDGYRLYAPGIPAHVISAKMVPSVKYDALKNFTPISGTVESPYFIVVNPSSAMASIADLIATAKANPGKVNFGSSGTGTGSHLTGEVLKQATGIDTVHVPFKGGAPAIAALLGGHIEYLVTEGSALSFIQSNQVRALAVTSLERYPYLPNIPTLNETVGKDFDAANRNALVGPAGLDPKVTAAIMDAVHKALQTDGLKHLYASQGVVPSPLTSEQLRRAMQADSERFGRIIQQLGLKAE
jgi:tripartite-type tricarboxylate transporter receptor subunit TctC